MSDITDLFSGQDRMAQPRGAAFFVQGTVADNGDKENAGRVKVEFTAWKQGGNICQWMPVLRGYAGGGYGVYCMPEVGDVVLVGFLGTDYSRPFVAGCFYPAGAAMEKECFTDKNTMRRFKTKGGVSLSVSDEKDKQSIEAVTPKGLALRAEDATQCVTLTDKDGKNVLKLDCKNGAVELTADASITLHTGKCELKMDGKSGALTLKCDKLDVKATQQATVASNQMLTLQGNMLKVDGKQTTQVSGGTMTQIKGGLVKIN